MAKSILETRRKIKHKKLKGKHILIGVTAGIAAYKTATLVRYFKKLEAEVKVIMTSASRDFITPLTLSTLSQNPVFIQFFDKKTGEWANHVELAKWADIFVIAPATADSIAKMANGHADQLLFATFLSATCPVIIAPAMDLDMYQHPSVQKNMQQLEANGAYLLPAENGFLASGLHGQGRMQEPEEIGAFVSSFLTQKNDFNGKKVLITAGPTYENIDPVRFIGNSSTGKMGFEIAKDLLSKGAEVYLISGPTHQQLTHAHLHKTETRTAKEMLAEVQLHWEKCDIGIFAAAVSDYRPKERLSKKIKKTDNELSLELVKNPDILSWAGENKHHQFLVGFALETQNAVEYGKTKLRAKNLDAIVVNSLEDQGAGFGEQTNQIKIINRDNKILTFELKEKRFVAQDIVNFIKTNYKD